MGKQINILEFEKLYTDFKHTKSEHPPVLVLNPFLYTPNILKDYTDKYIFIYDCSVNLAFPELFYKRLFTSLIGHYTSHADLGFSGLEEYLKLHLDLEEDYYSISNFERLRLHLETETKHKIKVVFHNFQEFLKFEKFYSSDFNKGVSELIDSPNHFFFLNLLSHNQINNHLELIPEFYQIRRFHDSELRNYLNFKIDIPADVLTKVHGNPYILDFIIRLSVPKQGRFNLLLEEGLKNFFHRVITMISGDISFKSIFLSFAYKDQLKLNEIAYFLEKKPGVIQTYLNRLLNFEIINKEAKIYSFNYPEILTWLSLKSDTDKELEYSIKKKPEKPARKKRVSKPTVRKPDIPDWF